MKKIFFMCLLVITTAQVTKAQTNSVTGSVKDEKGNPLHFVFVVDSQNNATFTDLLGNFTIEAKPGSKLQFELAGYKNALINIDKDNAGLQVVLTSAGPAGSGNSLSAQTLEVKDNSYTDLVSIGSGGRIAAEHVKGNVRGNQYLFDTFVHGFLINSSGELVYNNGYLFDYDKMGGTLLLTKDKKTIAEVSPDQIKSFTLYNNTDERFEFEKAPAIDNLHYVQVLASGKKYKIYKLIKTRLVKADYVNNGVTSHGNDYDEYVDDADYYVLDVQGNTQKKLSLKKKSIKVDFAAEADKVNKFLTDNSSDIDDAYLSKLGDYMNN